MKPTQRTLKYYKDQGYICDMIERWIKNPKHPAGGFRKDCFGFADILAFKPDESNIILIQSCGQDYAAHLRKILDEPLAAKWLMTGNRIVLIGWRKVLKKRGGKQKVWAPRIKEFDVEDLKDMIIKGEMVKAPLPGLKEFQAPFYFSDVYRQFETK